MSGDDMLFESNQNVLEELVQMILQISPNDYSAVSPVLRSASIGQHCRHIIELYQCLLENYQVGFVSYDKRKRDHKIETNKDFALSKIQEIIIAIIKPDKDFFLHHQIEEKVFILRSSYFREVLYNLEHCIHHQALIKLACQELEYLRLSESFGIARSTLAFRKVS